MAKQNKQIEFLEMLITLLKSNTSLSDSLAVLSNQGIEKDIKDTAGYLLLHMKKGMTFSESLYSLPKELITFNPLYIMLIKASEMIGIIRNVLEDICEDGVWSSRYEVDLGTWDRRVGCGGH